MAFSFEDAEHLFILLLAAAPVIIIIAYLSARAGAFAYFRTKRDHLKQVLQELKNGEM